jgi:hypothetical protein
VSSLLSSSADNRLLLWCDRADHWLDTHCAWLVPRFRHSVIVIEKTQAASEAPSAFSRSRTAPSTTGS